MSALTVSSSESEYSTSNQHPPKKKVLMRRNVRRLGTKDVPSMKNLWSSTTEKIFGEVDIYDIVYNCCLSLGVYDDDGKLVGAICLNDYPNVKSLPTWSWSGWLKSIFGLDMLTPVNSKWIELILFDPNYLSSFFKPILEVLFMSHRKIKYVSLAIPPGITSINEIVTDFASRIPPRGSRSVVRTTSLALLVKKDFVKPYRIRKAVEEDNDDVVEIIDRYSELLKKMYGEYYISELLTRFEGSTREVVVAEYNGYAVGVMVLNKTVNYKVLNESFEVGPFHGFKTPHRKDEFTWFGFGEDDSRSQQFKEESSMELIAFDRASVEDMDTEQAVYERLQTDESSSSNSSEESWIIDPSLDLPLMLIQQVDTSYDGDEYFSRKSATSFLSTCLLNTEDYARPSQQNSRRSRDSIMVDIKPTVIQEVPKVPTFPSYHGKEDAFVVEVLAAHAEHEASIEVLLECAFECFADKSYCLMCKPSMDPPIDFLKEFVRVTPRSRSTFPHELFVRHRNTLDCTMDVRISIAEDLPYVEEFLNQTLRSGVVFDQYEDSVTNKESKYISLIMTCENQIVGLTIISGIVDTNYLFAHFKLYEFLDEAKHDPSTVAMLENFLVYPVFQKHVRYFLNETLRLSDYTLLVYLVSAEDLDDVLRDRPLLNCIQYLIPVAPRRMPVYDPQFIDEAILPPPSVTEPGEVLSLFISSSRLSGVKRVEINTRIVVVGSGDTALAFLEALVFGSAPDLLVIFNNITVVSPHGLPFYKGLVKGGTLFQINRGHTVYKLILYMNLRIYVNTVYGVVNRIRRNRKIIIVNETTSLPYDYLVLFCGEQYRVPKLEFKARKKFSDFPDNAFMINTDSDIVQVFNRIRREKKEFMDWRKMGDERIVIYGEDMRALACLGALVEYGIPTSLLVLVKPTITYSIDSNSMKNPDLDFPDPEISVAIEKLLVKLGIKLYKGFKLSDWDTNEENKITHIEIQSKSTSLKVRCKFLFLYAEKSISNKTYQAIYKAGLVFDGKLVIDANFCTNDPFIFAAGTLTQYSRKYHAEYLSHSYYNAHEVGTTIGRQFRSMLTPEHYKKREREDVSKTRKLGTLPEFHDPIIEHCLLPGNVYYLNISPPGRHIPVEIEITSDDYGQLLVTGDYDNLDKQGYFRLHINRLMTVETICCLSKEPLDVENLVNLWGKHVTMLNDLLVRFQMGYINDFFEFFKEPWLCGIVYDKFPQLMEEIRELFMHREIEDEKTMVEIIAWYFQRNKWSITTERQNNEIDSILKDSSLQKEVEEKVMEYIQKNRLHLPMFAYPSLVQRLLDSHMRSPMFTKYT